MGSGRVHFTKIYCTVQSNPQLQYLPPEVGGHCMSVREPQRVVGGVVPEDKAVGVMFRAAAGDLLLLLKIII